MSGSKAHLSKPRRKIPKLYVGQSVALVEELPGKGLSAGLTGVITWAPEVSPAIVSARVRWDDKDVPPLSVPKTSLRTVSVARPEYRDVIG